MTEEELTVNWVTANTGFNPKEPLGKIAVRIFLAGLKAGRPEWHKVADGDLPKVQKDYITNIGVMTFTSLHDRLIWTTPLCEACDYYVEVTDEVIAWCEIPKYTEE